MTTLSDILPKHTKTVQAIYDYHKERGDSEPRRGYLGASIIGHKCDRYLWYLFRDAVKEKFDGRMYRLFETGDLEEDRFVKELLAIGCEVHPFDANGEQWEVKFFGGHFSGHLDAAILGIPEAPKTWHVGEFKTHNKKSFAYLKTNGVEKAKMTHYAQMQIYMHLTGMKRALYLARNKDNDELYSERVKYDKKFCEGTLERAKAIITAPEPGPGISTRPDFFECSWCSARHFCFPGKDTTMFPVARVSCRQCCHSDAVVEGPMEGCWLCEYGPRIGKEDQVNWPSECPHFLVNPSFVPQAEPKISGKDSDGNQYIELEFPGGKTIQHGNGNGMWRASELHAATPDVIGNQTIDKAKELFGAEVKGVTDEKWDETSEYAT